MVTGGAGCNSQGQINMQSGTDRTAPESGRWASRNVLGLAVQALAYAIPIGAAVMVSAVLSRSLGRPHGWGQRIGEWALLLTCSSAALVTVDRLSRRLLPLAALLKLSLVFPDRAPRRLAVAHRAGTVRNLHARIEAAKREGIFREPAQAAVAILELVGALHAHDRRTRGHSERVRALTDLLATELRLDPDDQDRLRWAALLHDVGKIHVPARILNKPGALSPPEWSAIHRHPLEGAKLAAPLMSWLGSWAEAIAHHHERYDGTGYPRGLQGDQISYAGRIVAVADAFEVMTAARSYKRPISAAAARQELTRMAGTQFDPAIVRAFLAISIGRLRLAVGPLSWLAQAPVVGWLPHAAEGVAAAGTQAAGVVGAAAGVSLAVTGGTPGLATPPPSVSPPPPAATQTVPRANPSGAGPGTAVAQHSTLPATAHPTAVTTTTTRPGKGNGAGNGKSGPSAGNGANSGGTRTTGGATTSTTLHGGGPPSGHGHNTGPTTRSSTGNGRQSLDHTSPHVG